MRTHTDGRERTRRLLRAAAIACGAFVLLSALGAQTRPPSEPRLAAVPGSAMTVEQQKIAAQFATLGMPNAVATYLQHPPLAAALLPHVQYVWRESTLPARHRALLGLRTAWLARSPYLWAHRAAAARGEGFTDAEIRRVAEGPDATGWEPFEATVLRAADELHVDSFVSNGTWSALAARYDINQLIDTVDTVGAFTMHAGAINSLGVQLEAGARDRPPADVPSVVAAKRTNIRLLGMEPRIPPVESRGGRGGANVFRTFVRNPPADRVRGAVNRHVNSASTLSPRHRELLLIRIGVLCRSEYEFAAHARVGRKLGITQADLARIVAGPESPGGDPIETALLRATDELFDDDVIANETWATLAAALNARQLLDVLIAVGGYRSTSMLINSAGVQLDADMGDFRFPPELR